MRKVVTEYRLVVLVVLANLVLWYLSPSKAAESASTAGKFLKEMLLILPPVFLFVGLLDVWVPRAIVERSVGQRSGIKGVAISMLLGCATVGPLYAAFPLAAALLKKGASVFNIVVFLTVKAGGEIPLVAMEAKFLGFPFALLRLALTFVAAPIIGWIVERVVGHSYRSQSAKPMLSE